MRWTLVSMVVVAAACGSSKQASEDKVAEGSAKPAKPAVDVPMALAYGECADPTTLWVSGPRPLPHGELDDPPPPPEEDAPDDGTDDAGGSGTSLALDEGKMGRKPGEYHMKGPAGKAELTREQAIDAARTAGILGTVTKREPTIFGGLEGTNANLAMTSSAPAFGLLGDGSSGHDSPIGSHPGGPTVTLGALPRDQSPSDKDMIRRYIHRNIAMVTYCYEKRLLADPTLTGTVTAKFFIDWDGSVKGASASGLDGAVAACVAKIVGAIKFAKPRSGGGIEVSYPFTFRPAGDDSKPATGSGSAAAPTPKPPAPARLYRSDAPSAASYRPGDLNDLREQDAGLKSCLRGNPTPYGAVVVELGATQRVYGLDDAKTQACVVEVAKKLVPMGQRCSFAFGVMPPAALPGIEIAGDTVTFAGKPLAMTADRGPMQSVIDAIRPTIKAATAATAPVVALHGPLVIRASDATTIKVLTGVIAGVLTAGEDFELAARQGSDWRLVDQLPIPVTPVPLGSGGRWNRVMGTPPDDAPRGDRRPHLSVLLAKDAIWVGVSRYEDYVTIPRDAAQWTKLDDTLKEKKVSAAFANRADIEIAADDDVTYRDLVKAIDDATRVGFLDWQITDPPGLSARPKR